MAESYSGPRTPFGTTRPNVPSASEDARKGTRRPGALQFSTDYRVRKKAGKGATVDGPTLPATSTDRAATR